MNRTVVCAFGLLVLSTVALCQDSSYYRAIQKNAHTQIQPKQFKEIEENALKEYSRPELYEVLATSFGNTTEKVWAVVYGEVFCNLSSDKSHVSQMGSLMFDWYDKAFSVKGDNVSVNLTENAEASKKQPPFEPQFEMAFLLGAAPLGSNVKPLSIQKLSDIRRNQLGLLAKKNIAVNDLTRWQQAVVTADHWEAYNYWLFQSARPDEFGQWVGLHQAQFQAWLDWQSQHKFTVFSPDFQRLYIVRAR